MSENKTYSFFEDIRRFANREPRQPREPLNEMSKQQFDDHENLLKLLTTMMKELAKTGAEAAAAIVAVRRIKNALARGRQPTAKDIALVGAAIERLSTRVQQQAQSALAAIRDYRRRHTAAIHDDPENF